MKIRWTWLDCATELAVGVVPVQGTVGPEAFYAEGEETVCTPAVRVSLSASLARVDLNRRQAVVDPIIMAANALLIMGLDLRKAASVPSVVLCNGMATATGAGISGNTLASHVGVSLPCQWESVDDLMAKTTIDCVNRLLYALRHDRT